MPVRRIGYDGEDAVESARAFLGLTYAEVAEAVDANETTLHRWRSARSRPTPVYQARLRALGELVDALERAFPGRADARDWLATRNPALGGRTPRELVLTGRGDVLLGMLLGGPTATAAPAPASPAPPSASGVTARVAAVLESTSDAFFALDLEWRFTYVNQRAAAYAGRSVDELVGQPLDGVYPGVFERRFGQEYQRAVDTQQPVTFEEFWDGSGMWTEVRAFPSPYGLAVFFQDITARKGAEAARAQLASVLETTPDIVVMATPGGRLVYANAAARAHLGAAALPGRTFAAGDVHPAWAHERIWSEAVPAALEVGSWRGTSAMLTADGREVPVSQVIVAGRDGAGRLEYFAMTMRDTSAERAAEAALWERKKRLRGLLDSLSSFVGLLGPDGTVLEVNATVTRFTGTPAASVVGRAFWDAPWMQHDVELQTRLRVLVAEAVRGNAVRVRDAHTRPDGRPVTIELSLAPVRDPHGRVELIVVEGRDVTRPGDGGPEDVGGLDVAVAAIVPER